MCPPRAHLTRVGVEVPYVCWRDVIESSALWAPDTSSLLGEALSAALLSGVCAAQSLAHMAAASLAEAGLVLCRGAAVHKQHTCRVSSADKGWATLRSGMR